MNGPSLLSGWDPAPRRPVPKAAPKKLPIKPAPKPRKPAAKVQHVTIARSIPPRALPTTPIRRSTPRPKPAPMPAPPKSTGGYRVLRMDRQPGTCVDITLVGEFNAGEDLQACEIFRTRFNGGIVVKGREFLKGTLSLFRPDGTPLVDPTYTYKRMVVYKTPDHAIRSLTMASKSSKSRPAGPKLPMKAVKPTPCTTAVMPTKASKATKASTCTKR